MNTKIDELLAGESYRLAKEIVGTGSESPVQLIKSRDLCINNLRSVADLKERLEALVLNLSEALPKGKQFSEVKWVNIYNPMTNPDNNIGHLEGSIAD